MELLFKISSLIADFLQSLTDFLTDIISSIASKVGKKKANKRYPFGYGMIENITNFIIGIIFVISIATITLKQLFSLENKLKELY